MNEHVRSAVGRCVPVASQKAIGGRSAKHVSESKGIRVGRAKRLVRIAEQVNVGTGVGNDVGRAEDHCSGRRVGRDV